MKSTKQTYIVLLRVLFIVGFVQCLTKAKSQDSRLDSLYKNYFESLNKKPLEYEKTGKHLFLYIDALRFNNTFKAKQYTDTLKLLAEKTNLNVIYGHYYYQLGMINKYDLLVKSAKNKLEKSLSYYQKENYPVGVANCYNGLAIIEADKANYKEALKLFNQSKIYYEKSKVIPAISQTLVNMAKLSEMAGDEQGAIEYLKEGLKGNVNNRFLLGYLIQLQLKNKEYKEARKNVSKLFETINASDEDYFLSDAYSSASHFYYVINQFDSAAVMMQKAIETALENEYYQNLPEHYRSLAQIYNGQNKLSEAANAVKKGFEWAEKVKSLSEKQYLYEILSQVENKSGNYKAALEAYVNSIEIKDTLQKISAREEFEKAKVEMDVLEKENKIALLNQEKELKEKEMQRQKYLRNSLIIVLIALLLLLIFIVKQRNKLERSKIEIERKNKELEKLNKAKNQIFSIIGHDLRKPFVNISSITELLKSNLISKNELDKLTDNLQETNQQTLEILDMLLLWGAAITQEKNIDKQDLDLKKTIDFNIHFYRSFAAEKNITIVNNTEKEIVFSFHKNQLNFIIRNLISNAIKFSYSDSEIHITAKVNSTQISISVKDFGIGISKENLASILNENIKTSTLGTKNEKGNGLGLHIVREFINENNGQLSIDSEPGVGSTFTVTFPKN